jgi:hypothetical protein
MRITPTAAKSRYTAAVTLFEVVCCILVWGIATGAALAVYIKGARNAEWSGYSLAAEGLNIQQLEQLRAAKWDTDGGNYVDETTNMNHLKAWTYAGGNYTGYSFTNLDIPYNSTNSTAMRATNYVTISVVTITTNPLVTVKFIRTDTVWSFMGKKFTNSIATYRAPDA